MAELTEQDIAEAFDVAVQDQQNAQRTASCKKKRWAPEVNLADDDDDNFGGRFLTKCEIDLITNILVNRLALKQITGPIAERMLKEKLNVLKENVATGISTVVGAQDDARQWLSGTRNCLTQAEKKAVHQISCPPSKAPFGTDNRDVCYDKLIGDINQVTRAELLDSATSKNKARVALNDVVGRYNCLVEELPALEQERDRLAPTVEKKRDELVRLKTDLATWNEEKPRMEAQLKDLTCLRQEKITEIVKIREEMEKIKQNMVNHESALNKLQCLPIEVQECYYTLEKLTRDYEEGRMRKEQIKEEYSKMFAVTRHLTEALLGLKFLPAAVRYFTENPDNSLIDQFFFERGIDTKRFSAIEAKLQHSAVLAERLRLILERFEQNERRVTKGLTY